MVELEIRPVHGDEILGPQPADRDQAFLEARAEPAARHAERLELDVAVADPGAKDKLAAAQNVERRQLFGQIERLMQRDQHEAADDPQTRGDSGTMGEKRDLLHGLEWVGAVMRALDDPIEAKPFGAPHQFEIVSQVLGRVAWRMLAAYDQAELHRA